MATIAEIAGNATEQRVQGGSSGAMSLSQQTSISEKKYENLSGDILKLIGDTGSAVEAVAKLGDRSISRLATDKYTQYQMAKTKMIESFTINNGKPIPPNEVDYEGLRVANIELQASFTEKFDTPRAQDLFDRTYTNPSLLLASNLDSNIASSIQKKELGIIEKNIENTANDGSILMNPSGFKETLITAETLGTGKAYQLSAIAINSAVKSIASPLDDPKVFEEINSKFNMLDTTTGVANGDGVRQYILSKVGGTFELNADGRFVPKDGFNQHISNNTINELNNFSDKVIGSLHRPITPKQESQATSIEDKVNIETINSITPNGIESVETMTLLGESIKNNVALINSGTLSEKDAKSLAVKVGVSQKSLSAFVELHKSIVGNIGDSKLTASQLSKVINTPFKGTGGYTIESAQKKKFAISVLSDTYYTYLDSADTKLLHSDFVSASAIIDSSVKMLKTINLVDGESPQIKTILNQIKSDTYTDAKEAYKLVSLKASLAKYDITNDGVSSRVFANQAKALANFIKYHPKKINDMESIGKILAQADDGSVETVKQNISSATRVFAGLSKEGGIFANSLSVANPSHFARYTAGVGIKVQNEKDVEDAIDSKKLTIVHSTSGVLSNKGFLIPSIPRSKAQGGGMMSSSEIVAGTVNYLKAKLKIKNNIEPSQISFAYVHGVGVSNQLLQVSYKGTRYNLSYSGLGAMPSKRATPITKQAPATHILF